MTHDLPVKRSHVGTHLAVSLHHSLLSHGIPSAWVSKTNYPEWKYCYCYLRNQKRTQSRTLCFSESWKEMSENKLLTDSVYLFIFSGFHPVVDCTDHVKPQLYIDDHVFNSYSLSKLCAFPPGNSMFSISSFSVNIQSLSELWRK